MCVYVRVQPTPHAHTHIPLTLHGPTHTHAHAQFPLLILIHLPSTLFCQPSSSSSSSYLPTYLPTYSYPTYYHLLHLLHTLIITLFTPFHYSSTHSYSPFFSSTPIEITTYTQKQHTAPPTASFSSSSSSSSFCSFHVFPSVAKEVYGRGEKECFWCTQRSPIVSLPSPQRLCMQILMTRPKHEYSKTATDTGRAGRDGGTGQGRAGQGEGRK